MSAIVAMLLDALAGEPPPALHPTAWMGRAIGAGRERRRATTDAGACAEGVAVTAGVALVAAGVAAVVDRAIGGRGRRGRRRGARLKGALLRGAALKPALALRGLLDAGLEVEALLRADDLPGARRALAYHLVSRDTTTLSASDVAGAAISSLAENLSDSVVAPLIAFRVGGLPAAYFYRAINTADAMLGYRTPDLEWFGKPAALTDDVINWVPARLSALLIALASGVPARALTCARADARRCPSPNGGWPMAAMAGALNVRLIKHGAYRLNDSGRAPGVDDIASARRLITMAAAAATVAVDVL